MEATQTLPATYKLNRPHPLVLVAAASVTAVSLAGVGVLAGWLPSPSAHVAEAAKTAQATQTAPAPISIQQTVTVPQEKATPKVAQRSSPAIRQAAPASIAVSPAPTFRNSTPVSSTPVCYDCGVVEAVREVAVEPKGSGGGAVAGGIVGGILGNQIGKGATRDIATVLGAVGGAYAGNHIEKSTKDAKRYDVVVRFEDGNSRTFSSTTRPDWYAGNRVRLQNGTLVPRDSGSSSGTI